MHRPRLMSRRQNGSVARVDADDDSITRYTVRLYAFDNARRERRHQVVAAFDNEAEAMPCFGRTHFDLLERSQSGRVDPREHVTIIVKEPGYAEHIPAQRI
jgi:hypothetical protein